MILSNLFPLVWYLDILCITNVVCFYLVEQRYLTLSGINHHGNAPQLPNLAAITAIAKNMSRTEDIAIYICALYHQCHQIAQKNLKRMNLCQIFLDAFPVLHNLVMIKNLMHFWNVSHFWVCGDFVYLKGVRDLFRASYPD